MKIRWAVSIWLFGSLFFSKAFCCLYNVRDVAFVDIVPAHYKLYYYVQHDTPEELLLTFKHISYVVFMESNVKVEVIEADQQKSHPAMEYFNFWEIKSSPAAILVSPRGHSLVVPLSIPNKSFKEVVWTSLEDVVSSPIREEILEHIVKAYCIVLLIEGGDSAENKRVHEEISSAVQKIAGIMRQLPKQIEEPPHIIVIPRELIPREKILLWSLDVNEYDVREPQMITLYGRGRRVGSLLKGKYITRREILAVLSVIGLSCECGLDRKWMMGTQIPIRWDETIQSKVVKILGFDAENPMVKTEMSGILSLGPSVVTGDRETGGRPDVSLDGYSEGVLATEAAPSSGRLSPAQFQALVSPEGTASDETEVQEMAEHPDSTVDLHTEIVSEAEAGSSSIVLSSIQLDELVTRESETSGSGIDMLMTLFILGIMVILIAAVSIYIYLRAQRRIT